MMMILREGVSEPLVVSDLRLGGGDPRMMGFLLRNYMCHALCVTVGLRVWGGGARVGRGRLWLSLLSLGRKCSLLDARAMDAV